MVDIASACFAVRTSPLSISAAEYCFPHLPGANWEKRILCRAGTGFTVLMEKDKGLLKMFIVSCRIVNGHKSPPFLCIAYCNRRYRIASIFYSIDLIPIERVKNGYEDIVSRSCRKSINTTTI